MADTGRMLDISTGEGAPQGPLPPSEAAPTAKAPSLGAQWKEFLSQPGNAAAMMQFGIKAMQPISPGQSVLGHIGNAIGAAGEAKQKVKATRLDEDYKRAQIAAAEGRADYYASGRGSLTAYQQMMLEYRNNTAVRAAMDDIVLMGDYGVLSAAELPPDQFAQLYAATAQKLGLPGSGGVAPAPSLGTATSAPPITRRDTEGRTWTLQNGQWVQTG